MVVMKVGETIVHTMMDVLHLMLVLDLDVDMKNLIHQLDLAVIVQVVQVCNRTGRDLKRLHRVLHLPAKLT